MTAKGQGRVLAQEILARKLLVEFEDQRRIIVEHDDILSVEPPRGRSAPAPADARREERGPFRRSGRRNQRG